MTRLIGLTWTLTTLTGCWPWIPGSASDYRQRDDAIVQAHVTTVERLGDYWENGGGRYGYAELRFFTDGTPFRWSHTYGENFGCSDEAPTADYTLEYEQAEDNSVELVSGDLEIELDWSSEFNSYVSEILEDEDAAEPGSAWELLAFEAPRGDISSPQIAQLPRTFELLEPQLDEDDVPGIELDGDLVLKWTNARADYYGVTLASTRNGQSVAGVWCRTSRTELEVNDRYLEDFLPGDIVYVRVAAVNESDRWVETYDEMARGGGFYELAGAFVVE